MKRMIVSPSVLSANFLNLGKDIEMLNQNADMIHLDVMDGIFVPNLSYGTPIVKAIMKEAKIPVEAHMMIVEPYKFYKEYSQMGVSAISVHYEACSHLNRDITQIKDLGMKAGVSINPHTNEILLEHILPFIDFVLIMSVNPGFGAQKYIPHSTEKIARMRALVDRINPNCKIEVDGGISLSNIEMIAEAGADIVVAGNSVFSAENPSEVIKKLQCCR